MKAIEESQKAQLQNRLQFAIVLTLFFPVIFGAGLKSGSSSADLFTVQWGVIIAVLIANYFLIESLVVVRWSWITSFSNLLIFTQIAMFGVVMYGLASIATVGLRSIWWLIPIGTAALGTLAMPTVLLFVLGLNFIYPFLDDIKKDLKTARKFLKNTYFSNLETK